MHTTYARLLLLSAVAAVLVLLGAGTALGSPEAVLGDYADDGVVQGHYSAADLSAALRLARTTEQRQYAAAADAIQAAQADELFGGRPSEEPHAAVPAKDDGPRGTGSAVARSQEIQRAAPASALALPSPPTVQPGAGVPWPFMLLSVGALLLVLGGTASAVHRRAVRRR